MMKLFRPFIALCAAVALTLTLTACSRDEEPAVVTLPENAPSTTVPPTLAPAPEEGSGEPPMPPEVAWVAQVGGDGEDVFNGIIGDGSDVVAVGATDGGIDGPTAGAQDILSARISAEGEVLASDVFGTTATDGATSVATVWTQGSGPGGPTSVPIACGSTDGDLFGEPLGLLDGWCGPVPTRDAETPDNDETDRLFGFAITPFAAESNESIAAIAASSPEDSPDLAAEHNMYLAGTTDGFYPGAGDSTGRGLGQGDALAFRASLSSGTAWIRQFGTPEPDAATGVCTVNGDAYFVGWTDGDLAGTSSGGRDAWISMIDRAGMQRWLTQFGYEANEEFQGVAAGGNPAEGTQQFVAVGFTDGDGPQPSNGGRDALVAAFAPDGTTLWSVQVGSALDDGAAAVAIQDSTIYVAGTTTSVAATEDAPAIDGFGDLDDTIGPGGATDAFLTAIDATTGSVLWTTRFGSAADETVTSMTITDGGLLAIAGSTTGALGENTSAGGRDGFVVAYQLPAAGGGAASWV